MYRVPYVQHKDEEVGLLALTTELLLRLLDVLLQLAHRILQGCPRVIDLIHDQDVLADQVGHLQRAQVQPLCAGNLGSGNLFGVATAKVFIER